MKCLDILKSTRPKYPVLVIRDGETAPAGTIAIYAGEARNGNSVVYRNQQWPSRHLRVAAHRIYETRPEWAETTPFVVAVRDNNRGHLDRALLYMAEMYTRWFRGEAGVRLPWETWNGHPTTYQDLMEGWFDFVQDSIGRDQLDEILSSRRIPDQYRDRGGAVVYQHFPRERVLTNRDQSSGEAKYLSFGTSSLASPHDFLQAMKAAIEANLPLQFFTYGEAYDAGRHLRERLLPSLKIFGPAEESVMHGLVPPDMWSRKALDVFMNPVEVSASFYSMGLSKIAETAGSEAGCNMAEWYRNALRILADKVLQVVKSDLLITLEEETLPAQYAQLRVSALADMVHVALGHSGNILNGPSGENVPSDLAGFSSLSGKTLGELFSNGWWLGGASIYYLWYKQSEVIPFVSMVNDGDWGKVNLMAREWLKPPYELYAMPVGYYRIYPRLHSGELSHTAIDPWVFLELMERWGSAVTASVIRRMWESLEAPLKRHNIGKRTYIEVGESGISVRVVPPAQ
jgi:hypothetical protein